MSDESRRRLTVRPRQRPSRAGAYLDMLEVLAQGELAAAEAGTNAIAEENAVPAGAASHPRPRRPASGAATEERPREWKLSARLDHELLSELYGAAEQLADRGATVSAMVEEALRRYLPELRRELNDGAPFPPAGPRTRRTTRRGVLGTDGSLS